MLLALDHAVRKVVVDLDDPTCVAQLRYALSNEFDQEPVAVLIVQNRHELPGQLLKRGAGGRHLDQFHKSHVLQPFDGDDLHVEVSAHADQRIALGLVHGWPVVVEVDTQVVVIEHELRER